MGGIDNLRCFVFCLCILFSVLLVTFQYDSCKLLHGYIFLNNLVALWVGLVIWVPFLLLFSLISEPNF